jgi:hypothetical protein
MDHTERRVSRSSCTCIRPAQSLLFCARLSRSVSREVRSHCIRPANGERVPHSVAPAVFLVGGRIGLSNQECSSWPLPGRPKHDGGLLICGIQYVCAFPSMSACAYPLLTQPQFSLMVVNCECKEEGRQHIPPGVLEQLSVGERMRWVGGIAIAVTTPTVAFSVRERFQHVRCLFRICLRRI